MSYADAALRIAERLPVGSTQREVCPACHGGTSSEKSFVVGREASYVWWKCFRATCTGVRGRTGGETLPVPREEAAALDRLRPYTRPYLPPESKDFVYFSERFGLSAATVTRGVRVSEDDEYLLPVRGPSGQIRGIVRRQPVWRGEPKPPRCGMVYETDDNPGTLPMAGIPMPKTKLYMHNLGPTIAWYPPMGGLGEAVVVVEDQVSAMRVMQLGVAAVALLGNSLNAQGLREIVKVRGLHKYTRLVVALDPGAEAQARKLALDWGLYFEKTRVLALEQDPKDTDTNTLQDELARARAI